MKLKLLLFCCLLVPGILNAQDTIRTLIITEVRMDRNDQSYIELTNVGSEPVQMNKFELGRIGAWTQPYSPNPNEYMMLPDSVLDPGESYVIAAVLDFTEEMYPLQPDFFNEQITKSEWWTLADMQLHHSEARGGPGTSDSISPKRSILETWSGRECFYLEQHLSETDSVIIDQVGGIFAQDDGTNVDGGMYDVAGVTGATGNSILVRKANVNQGNTDFDNARGIGLDDSEWLPLPLLYGNWEPYRAVFWTVGNHGNYTLDENTLVSDMLEVDWTNKTITAPWGVRNNDDFMRLFEKKPGIAWHYDLSLAREDSAYNSARTGDKLTIYMCGNTLETATFDIIVAEPTQDANIVVPKFAPERNYNPETNQVNVFFSNDINSGSDEIYEVTVDAPGMDTITNSLFGISHATRSDSLLKYLEKPTNATWEFIWEDGVERPDLKNGDILKVTSESGMEKEYFIKVAQYRPSHVAYLSAIIWPDIPEYLKGLFGWSGDTIPGFGSTVFNYKVGIPSDIENIPALVAKTQQLNASVDVKRASSFSGTAEQKTIDFTVTAEDDTTVNVYSVQLEKEKEMDDIQPFVAEPFLSELVFQDQWANGFIEICNPGNQPLDLSNYMMVFTYNDIAGAITDYSGVDQWNVRYRKYVPGYKWVDEGEWSINPGRLEPDLNVNPIILPGDVFVGGHLTGVGTSGYPWWASEQCDVILNSPYNPWNETYDQWASAVHEWYEGNFHLFKIENDSIRQGLKAANDPNDFTLIEVFGAGDGTRWLIGGELVDQTTNYMRKPQYWQGRTSYKESFGTEANNWEDCEWIWTNRPYWDARNIGWPNDILYITNDLGKHYMDEITSYKSTISSIVYKVSEGYGWNEQILGPTTGTTVSVLLNNVIKADENQSLKVVSLADGTQLAMDALLSMNDTLVVMSADSTNITKYRLDVTDEGLSSDAVLTSAKYDIDIIQQPTVVEEEGSIAEEGSGTISGFEHGTQLNTVLNNIEVPAGATLTIVDSDGAYVPQVMLTYDTSYMFVTVNPDIFFEVVAENGVTTINYQLQPQVSENTAFLTSDVYEVDQGSLLIHYVPRGTSVDAFLSNVVPTLGATVMVVDKSGLQRTEGQIYQDDRAVVTAPGGAKTVYFLSMLRTHIVQATTYLAYVTSNVYTVDQMELTIEGGLTGETNVADFYSRITPAMGATAVVVDNSGIEKTSGDLNQGDMVKVTSADGLVQVMYEIIFSTSVIVDKTALINVYPNPAKDFILVSGVNNGERILMFNSMGIKIGDFRVKKNIESISIEKLPAGIYLIKVDNKEKTLGQFKIIKD